MDCKRDGVFVIVALRGRRRKPRSEDCSFSCSRHLDPMVRRSIRAATGHRVTVSYSPVSDAPCEIDVG